MYIKILPERDFSIWNKLPETIKEIQSLDTFKSIEYNYILANH